MAQWFLTILFSFIPFRFSFFQAAQSIPLKHAAQGWLRHPIAKHFNDQLSAPPVWPGTPVLPSLPNSIAPVPPNSHIPRPFIPGGAVDARAYFPVAFNIAAQGWLCVIIQQTGRIAGSFNSTDPTGVINSTNPVFAPVPKNKWAIGGHSAGGQGAAAYVAANPTRAFALVMLAGGIAPANLSTNPTPVVNIVGTLDRLSGPGLSYLRYQSLVNPYGNPNVTLPLVPLQGGTHYQMGDYGYQYFDDIAVISQDQQQADAARLVVTYLDRLAPK